MAPITFRALFRRPFLGVLIGSFCLPAQAADHWITAKTAHFQMYSDESETESRDILIALEEFRANLLRLLPLPGASEPRTTVIVFDRESGFRPYKPLYQGKPKDLAGYFLPQSDEVMIAMTTDLPNPDQDPRGVMYHEYVHLLLNARDAKYPPWLDEGLAEVFSTFKVAHGKIGLGEPVAPHVALLQESELWPLPRLFAVTHESPDYNEDSRMSMFYAESWALTHYLLFGADQANAQKLGRFAHQLSRGGDIATSFHAAFGMDFWRLETALREYLSGGRYYKRGNPAIAQNIPVTFRPASDVERDAALLNLKWRVRHNDDAAAAAFALLKRDPNQARPHELLAAIAADSGDSDGAREHWQKAAELGSDNPWVHVQLLREAVEPYEGATMLDVRLPDEHIAPWRAWAARACALSPESHDANELALTVEALADKMDLRVASRGQAVTRTLRDPARALMALAIIHWRLNSIPSARVLVNLVEAQPKADLTTRAIANALRYRLPPEEGASAQGSPATVDTRHAAIALRTTQEGEAEKYLDHLLDERGSAAPRLKLDALAVGAPDPSQPDPWQRADDLRAAAQAGDAAAMYALAVDHSRGAGVDFSPALARAWLQKAADHGHAIARFALGSGQVAPESIVQMLRIQESAGDAALPPLDTELAAQIAKIASGAFRRPLEVVYRCTPRFPRELRQRGGKGEAVVRFAVQSDGHPADVQAAEYSDPVSAAAAEDCIRAWRFIPTIRDGEPIGTLAELTITFQPAASGRQTKPKPGRAGP